MTKLNVNIQYEICHLFIVRKAFYKLSLLHHPDRHDSDSKSEATKRFQVLSRVYSYMEDDEKRKVYDETGWFSICKNRIILIFRCYR